MYTFSGVFNLIFCICFSEVPELDNINESCESDYEDDVVLNGHTLSELNQKRGGANGIKYFLKDVVRTQMKKSGVGPQSSMYDIISQIKAQGDMVEVDNEATVDMESLGKEYTKDDTFKLVVDTEKVLCRELQ